MHDAPIVIEYGNAVLDLGIGTVPLVLLNYYRHLESDGERLDDREMMPLVLITALWEGGERVLRPSNLPSATPVETLERKYLAKWRRMGLVFTRRVYYSFDEMVEYYGGEEKVPSTPRMKARLFDLSSLLYNCLRVFRLWQEEGYPAALAEWEKALREWEEGGKVGPPPQPPHPRIPPPDFRVEVEIPPDVALRLVRGGDEGYQFVPDKWIERAKRVVDALPARSVPVQDRTGTNRAGTGGSEERTGTKRVGTESRTGTNRAGTGGSEGRTGTNRAGTEPRTGTNRAGQYKYTSSLREEGTLSAYAESGPPSGPSASAPAGTRTNSPSAPSSGKTSGRSLPAEGVNDGAMPDRPPAREGGAPPAASVSGQEEPLPQRRRRVLADLRRMQKRRARVAILAKNIGAILGLGYDEQGVLRVTPERSDYRRIGGMAKRYGAEKVWLMACRIAGHAIEGDPLDYLEACLRNDGRNDVHRPSRPLPPARGSDYRNGYPTSPDEYGDGYEV